MPSPLPQDVQSAMAAGQKIEAIRLLRERTGLGLAEAKAAVEAGSLPQAPADPPAGSFGARELPPQALAALAAGKTIEAIRLVRLAHGVGLKDAKGIVDAYIRRSAASTDGMSGLAPGELRPSRLGSWGWIGLALVCAAVGWLVWAQP